MSSTETLPAPATGPEHAPRAERTTPAVDAPSGAPPAAATGVAIALVVVALGVVAVRDALVALGWVPGPSWLEPVAGLVADGVGRDAWVLLVAVLVALLGAWLVRRALGRRPRTAVSLGDGTNAWLEPRDVARVADLAASDVDGVVTVRSRAARRSVALKVTVVDTAAEGARSAVQDAVRDALEGLDPAPRVSVKVSTLGGSR